MVLASWELLVRKPPTVIQCKCALVLEVCVCVCVIVMIMRTGKVGQAFKRSEWVAFTVSLKDN